MEKWQPVCAVEVVEAQVNSFLHDFMAGKPLGSHFPPLVLFYDYEKSLLRALHITSLIESHTLPRDSKLPFLTSIFIWSTESCGPSTNRSFLTGLLLCAKHWKTVDFCRLKKKEKRDLIFDSFVDHKRTGMRSALAFYDYHMFCAIFNIQ